ncbi:MAG: hypothetical protein F4Z75_08725 [Synechococcus sp. SB0668_bin_15]|nr:hypothetical protein [Synechococcus sp. SB0668_bin_15]MXZ83197.1 hypothetical protein [Synechococcus sp. SB0666_bin_14]MYC49432.1 hypothetical protein [Synechococcus sp. SB0662_bin_14]MYG47539.1 hypothetical protein [Synechococcus sp. SB0675_bin_6]MYJ59616.1 hypothetical protein [Synechococcus sp. SB0672_bin_6]MYK91677.1 hypothetical protein [Synechococcus sp. SB0669_bin_8]
MSALFTVLPSWIQSGTLSLVGVILLWQQVRFLGKRLDEFKGSQDKRLDEVKGDLKDLRSKMDRVLELLAAQAAAREALSK